MVLRQEGFTIVMETMAVAVAEDLHCTRMMTSTLMMPFIQGAQFGMHLLNL
jgi:hypothetical protein